MKVRFKPTRNAKKPSRSRPAARWPRLPRASAGPRKFHPRSSRLPGWPGRPDGKERCLGQNKCNLFQFLQKNPKFFVQFRKEKQPIVFFGVYSCCFHPDSSMFEYITWPPDFWPMVGYVGMFGGSIGPVFWPKAWLRQENEVRCLSQKNDCRYVPRYEHPAAAAFYKRNQTLGWLAKILKRWGAELVFHPTTKPPFQHKIA